MAIYRIYPESDAFLASEVTTGNAGRDEIVELGGYEDTSGTGRTNRIVVKFNRNEILDVVNSKIGSSGISASLNYYLAEASELPVSYKVYSYPLAQDWDNGTGKFGDTPINTTGVSWTNTKAGASTPWITAGWGAGITGSFSGSQTGGGSWYTGSGAFALETSQSFSTNSDKDISIDVSNAVELIYSGSINNYGHIIKLENQYEFNTDTNVRLKFFGNDTNTIYPPYLEFKWDDVSYNTGSLNVLTTDISTLGIKNNRERYESSGKTRFRLSARPKYPTRTFTTASAYLTNYALPENSYWGVKDEYTEEMVIDFDRYTKVSCDSTGPYFDVYMDSFQPERYYRLMIKSTIDGSEIIFADKNTFKVVRNV